MHRVLTVIATHGIMSVVAALAVLAGSYVGYNIVLAQKAPESNVQTAQVERGNLVLAVNASGSITSPRAVDLSFRQSGTVAEVYVAAGDSVTTGQSLAKLDSQALEFSVRQSEIAFRSAQLSLDALTAGARPEDIQAANASVESARSKLANMEAQGDPLTVAAAQASYDSAQAKYNAVTNPSAADLANAQATVDTANANLATAQAKLIQLRNPTITDISAAESTLAAASAKLNQLRNPTIGDVAAAQAQVASAQANLASARTKLDQLKNPPTDKVADAQSAVKSAENTLLKTQGDLSALQDQYLNDEKLKHLVETFTKLYLARQKLNEDRMRSASSDLIASDEQEVLNALRNVQSAESDANQARPGVSVSQVMTASGAVDKAQSDLGNAKLKLNNLLHPTDSDVSQAENDAAAAQASAQSAQAKLAQLRNPSAADGASAEGSVAKAQSDLDKLRNPQPADAAAAEASVASAQASLSSAQAKLMQLQNPTDVDLAASNSTLAQAQNQLQQAQVPYKETDLASQRASLQSAIASLTKTTTPGTAQDIAKGQLGVDKAQHDLDQAKYNLDQGVLKAPFDGVIAKVSIVPGGLQSGAGGSSNSSAGSGAISIIDPNGMQVQVTVDESDVSKLSLGQTADVQVDAAGPRPYVGRVVAISPSGTVQSGVTIYQVLMNIETAPPAENQGGQRQFGQGANRQGQGGQGQGGQGAGAQGQPGQRPAGNQRSGSGNVAADNAPLRAGMTAVANITYAQRQNVLLVPSRALRRSGQGQTVQLQVNGKAETRPVTTGLADDQRTEITNGLQEGDTVLIENTARTGTTGTANTQNRPFTGGPGGFGGGGGVFVAPR